MGLKKTTLSLDKNKEDLLKRQGYLVTEANDLAKAFGNLTLNEQRILDFCVSFVRADSKPDEYYHCHILDILRHYGWIANDKKQEYKASGRSYKRVADAFSSFEKKDSLRILDKQGRVHLTHLFADIIQDKKGKISFQFSSPVTDLLVGLKEKYFDFHLWEVEKIKSKYTYIMYKLWKSYRTDRRNNHAYISAPLDQWEHWFLGNNQQGRPRYLPAFRFKDKVLNRAKREIENKIQVWVEIENQTRGRKIVGYNIIFHDEDEPRHLN